MKKIFNWTFGSVFRTFGRILAYLIVGALITLLLSKNSIKLPHITDLLLFDYVKAEQTNVNVNSYGYNIYYYNVDDNTGNVTEQSTGWFTGDKNNFRSGYNTFEKYYVQMNTDTLEYNQVYTINYSLWLTTRDSENYYKSMQYMILGSSNGQYSGATSENIQSYTCIATIPPDTTSRVNVTCNIVPKYNINYLYIRATSQEAGEEITSIGNNKPTITYNNSQQATENAINNQTTIIQNGNEQTQTIINNGFNDLNENINNQFNTKCPNLYNSNLQSWQGNGATFTKTKNGFNISSNNNQWAVGGFIVNVKKNTTYYLKFNSTANKDYVIAIADRATEWGNVFYETHYNKTNNINFNTGNNSTILIRIFTSDNDSNNLTINFTNVMLSEQNIPFCEYGSSTNKLDETNQSINDLNDSINDDYIGGASSEASDLFNNFTDSDFGLSGVITAPLNLIRSLTSKSCSQIVLPLPFVNENLTLPCLSNIYRENFSGILNIYQIVLFAIVGYRICVSIFFMVKGFKNPDEDRIEVLDL